MFERLSPEPVAAASLGQVYKGTLRANGAVVAVKVQRPGVEPQVLLDLYLLRYVAERSLNDYALKNLGVQATLLVDEFGTSLSSDVDGSSIWTRVIQHVRAFSLGHSEMLSSPSWKPLSEGGAFSVI